MVKKIKLKRIKILKRKIQTKIKIQKRRIKKEQKSLSLSLNQMIQKSFRGKKEKKNQLRLDAPMIIYHMKNMRN